MNPAVTFGGGIPQVPGSEHYQNWEDFFKAITAGYGTDLSQLSGGGALRVESLEATLMSVVQTVKDFALMNNLKKSPAKATVDEWIEKSGVGGRMGGAFNSELGTIQSASGTYNRRVALVKYLMTRREVSFVQNVQQTVVSAKAEEEVNGTLELLTSAEWACFYGDSTVIAEEYDGLTKVITDVADADHVIDMAGAGFDTANGFESILDAAGVIRKRGNFGIPTDIYMSVLCQSDLDRFLDPAFRVPMTTVPDGGMKLGAPVNGIRTSYGDIKTHPDIFVEESKMPAAGESPITNTTSNPTRPATVSLAVAAVATSKFGAAHAGNYYWAVAGINALGESDLRISAQQAMAAGQKCTLTIGASGAQDESGYAIYRSRMNGTNGAADFRLMTRIARTGASTTFVDENRLIPGTSSAFVLNMSPAMEAISWRQLLPMTRFQLYPTMQATDPWAQLLFGYLRVTKARQHVLIKNILPSKAAGSWNPFA